MEVCQFLKQGGKVDNDAVSDNIYAVWIDKSAGQQMKIKLYAINDNSMSGVVSALTPATQICFLSQYVNQLALSFVTPLWT